MIETGLRVARGIVRRCRRLVASERTSPFYLRRPYRGGVPIEMADMRGMVALDHGFFYNRIPKSGNSTVSVAVARACGVHVDPADAEGDAAKDAFQRPSNLRWRDLPKFNGLYKFTFVRDPYARVLSAYLDKVSTGLKVTSGSVTDLASFCQYLDDGGLKANAHWAPQSSLLLIPASEFDFIGRVESLDDDLATVFAKLGWPAPPFERRGPQPTNAGDRVDQFYTDETRDIVQRLYRPDFDLNPIPRFRPANASRRGRRST